MSGYQENFTFKKFRIKRKLPSNQSDTKFYRVNCIASDCHPKITHSDKNAQFEFPACFYITTQFRFAVKLTGSLKLLRYVNN